MREAAKRITAAALKSAIEICTDADNCVKTSQTDMTWHRLEQVALLLAGMMPEELA